MDYNSSDLPQINLRAPNQPLHSNKPSHDNITGQCHIIQPILVSIQSQILSDHFTVRLKDLTEVYLIFWHISHQCTNAYWLYPSVHKLSSE